jgi:small-conductance mechanosensitive channel
MDSLFARTFHALRTLLTTGLLSEFVALVLAVAAGGLVARICRRRQRAVTTGPVPPPLLREGLLIAAPYAATLIVLLAARALLTVGGGDLTVLRACVRLVVALILIRGAVFLLRVSLGPRSRFGAWETRIAFIAWFIVAMHLLGWLEAVIGFMDRLTVVPNASGVNPITLWSIIRSLFTVIAFVIITAWVGRWVERRVAGVTGLAAGTRIAVAKFAYAFLIGFGILLGLAASGLNLGALSFFGGALGLGLGFGLQSIAANFVSGFVLLMDKSIKPGDVISFTGTLGTSTEGFGWVQELRGRYVVVRDRDGVETLVPNQNLITNQVINWSYSDRRVRLKLPVRISYEDNPELAMQVLVKAAEGHHRILRDPAPVARLMSFHDYGMDLELRFWIADPEEGVNNVRSDVNRTIWRLFKEAGITIPRAQLELSRRAGRRRAPDAPAAER